VPCEQGTEERLLGPRERGPFFFCSGARARGLRRLQRGRAPVVYNAGYLAPRRPVAVRRRRAAAGSSRL